MRSVYDTATGLFTGQRLSGPPDFVAANTPAGCATVEGEHDHLSRRVNVETGNVIDWRPPRPARHAECTWHWDKASRRWTPRPTNLALAREVRAQRDSLLKACDWIVSRSAERGEAVPEAWRSYREALREVPKQKGFPRRVEWPEAPG